MPFRAHSDDVFIHGDRDAAAGGDDDRLAVKGLLSGVEMGENVCRHLLAPGLMADDGLQSSQLSLSLLCRRGFLVFSDGFNLGVQELFVFILKMDLNQARCVINRHGGFVLNGLLYVIDIDVIAKDRRG